MKKYRCEMCGKRHMHVQDHHIIPWRFSYDDSESNVIRVCPSCHHKADTNFTNLIMYGEMNISKRTHSRTSRRYIKKYIKYKTLCTIGLSKYTYYQDMMYYNIKTGHINITHSWRYNKSNKHISSNVNSRKRLIKAASVKSQTTLVGGIIM